jgi:hypothetical protein
MIKLLHIYLRHFPRYEKNALAQRILNTAYDVFELIVEGQKMYYKKTTLTKLDKTHEILKMQIWLAHELDYFSFKDGRPGRKKTAEHRHSAISSMVTEVGKMIGGWIKKIKEENQWK